MSTFLSINGVQRTSNQDAQLLQLAELLLVPLLQACMNVYDLYVCTRPVWHIYENSFKSFFFFFFSKHKYLFKFIRWIYSKKKKKKKVISKHIRHLWYFLKNPLRPGLSLIVLHTHFHLVLQRSHHVEFQALEPLFHRISRLCNRDTC